MRYALSFRSMLVEMEAQRLIDQGCHETFAYLRAVDSVREQQRARAVIR